MLDFRIFFLLVLVMGFWFWNVYIDSVSWISLIQIQIEDFQDVWIFSFQIENLHTVYLVCLLLSTAWSYSCICFDDVIFLLPVRKKYFQICIVIFWPMAFLQCVLQVPVDLFCLCVSFISSLLCNHAELYSVSFWFLANDLCWWNLRRLYIQQFLDLLNMSFKLAL